MSSRALYQALLVTVFVASSWAHGDYLEVRRSATLKARPERQARTVEELEPKQYLLLLSGDQTNGYYRARHSDTGRVGWVYRTFVRRYPGDPPRPAPTEPEAPPDEDVEAREDLDRGLDGTTAADRTDEVFEEYRPYDPSGKYFVYAGLPLRNGYPNDVRVLKNIGYVVGHDDVRRNPAYACYRAFPFDYQKSPNRPKFSPDARTTSRVRHEDYTKSGYSRGHMAPNYIIWQCYGDTARRETFLTSNVTPQFQSFNGGVWEQLEEIIADGFAYDYEEVWVICGPLYDSQPQYMRTAHIEVPDAFFMIILDEEEGQPRALAFRFDHTNDSGGSPESALRTVRQLEAEAGFDFFADLPDAIETTLETTRASRLWAYTLRNN